MKTATTRSLSHADFVAARKSYIGGSDIASVKNVGRYGCSRKLGYDKLEYPKDIDDSEKMEFRRGHRLEGIAAGYYEERSGRETWITSTIFVPGKPHLAVNIDRFTAKVEDKEKKSWGYLEIKAMGRFAFLKAKKEGLIDDYILQLQYGCAVADVTWGSYGIYCPDLDELLWWDVEADKALGDHLLEAADDWWNFHVGCHVLPEPLPDGSPVCEGCSWAITCRGQVVVAPSAGTVSRPDLEGLVGKFLEMKGMGSEVGDAAEGLREEILEAVKSKPGTYICGRYELPITQTVSKRFQGELLKQKNPALYEECRVETSTLTVRKPKEI